MKATADDSKNKLNRLRHKSSSNSVKTLLCPNHNLKSIYGCIVQPPELTNEVRLDVEKIITQKPKESNLQQASKNNQKNYYYGDQFKAAMSQKGKDHVQNQDRGIIISPFRITEPVQQTVVGISTDVVDVPDPSLSSLSSIMINDDDHDNFIMGIFDGHGSDGHDVAEYLKDNVPKRISSKIYRLRKKKKKNGEQDHDGDKDILRILKDTFIEIDQELPNDLGYTGGSTASIILRLGNKLYFSNTGDSLSFLAMYNDNGTSTIVHKNRFDKAYIPEEKDRITKLGGKVFIPPHPENARVNAYDERRKEVVSLGMSRAIGDWYHGKVGVIAEPIVDVIQLETLMQGLVNHNQPIGRGKEEGNKNTGETSNTNSNTGLYVVSSSDGLYDHRKKEFVADRFGKCFFGKSSKEEENCHAVVESVNLIDLATPKREKGYHDDITVLAMRVEF